VKWISGAIVSASYVSSQEQIVWRARTWIQRSQKSHL